MISDLNLKFDSITSAQAFIYDSQINDIIEGEALKLRTTILPSDNTWSDLSAEKDFTTSMLSIKDGGYSNLPSEIIDSITNNVDENSNITFGDKEK